MHMWYFKVINASKLNVQIISQIKMHKKKKKLIVLWNLKGLREREGMSPSLPEPLTVRDPKATASLSGPSCWICDTGLQPPWPCGSPRAPCPLPPQGLSSTRNPFPSPICLLSSCLFLDFSSKVAPSCRTALASCAGWTPFCMLLWHHHTTNFMSIYVPLGWMAPSSSRLWAPRV